MGGGGQGFCDYITEALVVKRVTMGVKNCPKLRTSLMENPWAEGKIGSPNSSTFRNLKTAASYLRGSSTKMKLQ